MLQRIINKIIRRVRGGVVTLHPTGTSKGRVLLSYKTEPFVEFEEKVNFHTNVWECNEIANIFLELGYEVDVIDWFNSKFEPKNEYKYFIDIGLNLERIGALINKDCIRIFHATTSHWQFNNRSEEERLLTLEKRRGVKLKARRILPPNKSIELADFVTLLGNEVTENTYAYAGKKIYHIPLSTTHLYPFSKNKDWGRVKLNFIWLGGVGLVHKGLDLVLEAFSKLPEYQLFVCGPIGKEKDFEDLYRDELYNIPNIKTLGRVDVGGEIFRNITNTSATLVYPSCAEGQAGSVITCMHAGLIPAISLHSGVNIGDFGVLIEKETVDGVMQTVCSIAQIPDRELEERSRKAWECARRNHTREKFSEEYRKFVKILEHAQ